MVALRLSLLIVTMYALVGAMAGHWAAGRGFDQEQM
jgi:hypothetical protein